MMPQHAMMGQERPKQSLIFCSWEPHNASFGPYQQITCARGGHFRCQGWEAENAALSRRWDMKSLMFGGKKKPKLRVYVRVHITKSSPANFFHVAFLQHTTLASTCAFQRRYNFTYLAIFYFPPQTCFISARYQTQVELFCHLPRIHRQDPIFFPN